MHSHLPGGLMPPPLEQQIPTVLLPQIPTMVIRQVHAPEPVEQATLGQLGTLPARLDRDPGGWIRCWHCGRLEDPQALRAKHRQMPGRRRWWHRLMRIRPPLRCMQQAD